MDHVGRRGLFEPREDFPRLPTYGIPWLDSVARFRGCVHGCFRTAFTATSGSPKRSSSIQPKSTKTAQQLAAPSIHQDESDDESARIEKFFGLVHISFASSETKFAAQKHFQVQERKFHQSVKAEVLA